MTVQTFYVAPEEGWSLGVEVCDRPNVLNRLIFNIGGYDWGITISLLEMISLGSTIALIGHSRIVDCYPCTAFLGKRFKGVIKRLYRHRKGGAIGWNVRGQYMSVVGAEDLDDSEFEYEEEFQLSISPVDMVKLGLEMIMFAKNRIGRIRPKKGATSIVAVV